MVSVLDIQNQKILCMFTVKEEERIPNYTFKCNFYNICYIILYNVYMYKHHMCTYLYEYNTCYITYNTCV